MELWQLRYFYTVAAEENITRAARVLNISQPALSAAISKLEDELGCLLFDRQKGRILLNSAGRELMRHVPRILESVSAANAAMGQYNLLRHSMVPIRLGSADLGLLKWLLKEYTAIRPEAIFSCDCRDEGMLTTDLENGRLDFAILEPTFGKQFCWTPLINERMVLYVNREHEFAEREYIRKSELRGVNFIQLRPASDSGKRFPYEFQPRVVLQTSDTSMALDYVKDGLGVAILPERAPFCCMPEQVIEKIRTVPIKDFNEIRTMGIIFKRGMELPEQAREAFDFMASKLLELGEDK